MAVGARLSQYAQGVSDLSEVVEGRTVELVEEPRDLHRYVITGFVLSITVLVDRLGERWKSTATRSRRTASMFSLAIEMSTFMCLSLSVAENRACRTWDESATGLKRISGCSRVADVANA